MRLIWSTRRPQRSLGAARSKHGSCHYTATPAKGVGCCYNGHMSHTAVVAIGLIVMISLIVGLDVAFLRDRFALRLATNVSIVAVFLVAALIWRHRL